MEIAAKEKPNKVAQVRKHARAIMNDALETTCRLSKERAMNCLMEAWCPLINIAPCDSKTMLPTETWLKIFSKLCDVRRSISDIVKDVASVTQVCKEFHAHQLTLLKRAGDICPHLEGPRELWDRFVRNPGSLSCEELSHLCKVAHVPVDTSNALMILTLLNFLGTNVPCQVPARLLVAKQASRLA